MEFGVSVLLRPEIKGDRGKLIDQRFGQAILGHIDGLDVGLAGVAALHPNIGKRFGGIDGQFGVIFLAASGTNDAAELPFGKAEAAEQAAAASIALLSEDAERGFAIAERAEQRRVALQLQRSAGAGEFGVGLEKSKHEEFLGIGGRVDMGPALGEQVGEGIGI